MKTPMTPLMYIKCLARSLGMLDLCDCCTRRSGSNAGIDLARRRPIGKNRLGIETLQRSSRRHPFGVW